MKNTVVQYGVMIVLGMVLMASQGCGIQWVKADGEDGTPKTSDGASDDKLSGFSQNPSEERLSSGGIATSTSPSGAGARRLAELTKEELAAEKAAEEAGLQDVFYGYDQWMVSDAGVDALDHDAAYLKEHPEAVLSIEGHCDERGTSEYNLVLGDKRAKAARTYLIESGVKPKQIAILSFGKERPFCEERTESCYQQNRRGHMLLNLKK
ncbi:MAG: OmpA family protein [Nitrospira sp.]|nr:OmpA family protein [Nitrospira sp.]